MTTPHDCVGEAAVYFEPIERLLEPDARHYLESNKLARPVISALAEVLKKRESISSKDIGAIGKEIQEATGAKGKDLYMPVRAAITGRLHGPELARALSILGKDRCVSRVEKLQAMM